MKKLLLISVLLLFGSNIWAQRELTAEELEASYAHQMLQLSRMEYNECNSKLRIQGEKKLRQPCEAEKDLFNGSIQCFSSNSQKAIIDLKNIGYIRVRKAILYKLKDGRKGEINISGSTCNIQYSGKVSICSYKDGKEVDMKYCKNKDYKNKDN